MADTTHVEAITVTISSTVADITHVEAEPVQGPDVDVVTQREHVHQHVRTLQQGQGGQARANEHGPGGGGGKVGSQAAGEADKVVCLCVCVRARGARMLRTREAAAQNIPCDAMSAGMHRPHIWPKHAVHRQAGMLRPTKPLAPYATEQFFACMHASDACCRASSTARCTPHARTRPRLPAQHATKRTCSLAHMAVMHA